MAVRSTEWCVAERFWSTCRCITAAALAAISPILLANTITVDDASSGSVPGKCTVQDAFVAANTNVTVNGCAAGSVGVDTIVFAPGITNIVLADRFPPGFGSYGLEAQEDLIVDGGAVPGSGVPVVTITRSTAVGVPVFGMIFASGHGGGGGPSFNFTLKGMKITGAAIAGALLGDNVTVSDSVIDGNVGSSSNGGIRADTLTITDSTVSNNSFGNGAGIATNTLILTNTTVSGNSGDPGGIYANVATLTNATISGNTSAGAGSTAGISLNSGTLKFVTITANAITGGAGSVSVGMLFGSVFPVSLSHVVIAGNLGGPGSTDFDARFAQANTILGDHNWIGSMGASGQFSIASGALIASCAATNFGPLVNNGGGKATHALLAGSCLIDAGAACGASPLPFDERGTGFNRCIGGAYDIGAFENQTVSSSPPTITANPVDVTVNAGGTAVFTAAASGAPAPTVQWQFSTDGGATFNNVAGAITTTLTVPNVLAGQNGTKFRAVFTNGAGTATTTAATMTVNFAPSVTTNPSEPDGDCGVDGDIHGGGERQSDADGAVAGEHRRRRDVQQHRGRDLDHAELYGDGRARTATSTGRCSPTRWVRRRRRRRR